MYYFVFKLMSRCISFYFTIITNKACKYFRTVTIYALQCAYKIKNDELKTFVL